MIITGVSMATVTLTGYTSVAVFSNATPELKVFEIGLGRRVAFIADLHIHRRGEGMPRMR